MYEILRIAMPMVENRNAIWWDYVDTGTINRPLRLRGGRGDTWIIINKNNEIGNANIYQRTFRNIHLLRKCMAANTPQGVGADSSRPFYNPNQMVLMCRNDMNCNANNANMQRHFVEFRGHGHDKSAPTPTGWTGQNVGERGNK